MIKMRLEGTLEEIERAIRELKAHQSFTILSRSQLYKDRGDSVYYRVYLDVNLSTSSKIPKDNKLPQS